MVILERHIDVLGTRFLKPSGSVPGLMRSDEFRRGLHYDTYGISHCMNGVISDDAIVEKVELYSLIISHISAASRESVTQTSYLRYPLIRISVTVLQKSSIPWLEHVFSIKATKRSPNEQLGQSCTRIKGRLKDALGSASGLRLT